METSDKLLARAVNLAGLARFKGEPMIADTLTQLADQLEAAASKLQAVEGLAAPQMRGHDGFIYLPPNDPVDCYIRGYNACITDLRGALGQVSLLTQVQVDGERQRLINDLVEVAISESDNHICTLPLHNAVRALRDHQQKTQETTP